jgi:transcriptional regulator with XRE-family HTH domain
MNADDLEEAISHLGLDLFSEDTRRRVEGLLANGQSVEPDARVRLVGAAQRGLRQHALEREVFEVLAFETRKRSDLSVDILARDLGVEATTIRKVESGRSGLQSLDAATVAAWIEALHLEDDVALRAVRSSLRPRQLQDSYASAEDEADLGGDAQAFYNRVCDALEKRRQSQ